MILASEERAWRAARVASVFASRNVVIPFRPCWYVKEDV